jgi:hypothetical protein
MEKSPCPGGVSSFGFGGTNAHALITAPPTTPRNHTRGCTCIKDQLGKAIIFRRGAFPWRVVHLCERSVGESLGPCPLLCVLPSRVSGARHTNASSIASSSCDILWGTWSLILSCDLWKSWRSYGVSIFRDVRELCMLPFDLSVLSARLQNKR